MGKLFETFLSVQKAVPVCPAACLHRTLSYSKYFLQVIGVKGPLPPVDGMNKTHAMEINPPFDLGWHHQSVAFIVL